ncbi:MAG: sugar ABC transporter permease [Clostridia bacterium]
MNGQKIWKTWSPFLFIVPALVFYLYFVVYASFNTFYLSLCDWNGVNPVKTFVGLANYINLLKDPLIWKALTNNIIWILVTVFIPTMLALILAVMLAKPGIRGVTLFRVTFFMPSIVSMVVVSIVWKWIFNQSYGTLNQVLRAIGLQNLTTSWLGNPATALGSLLTAGSWTHYGFCMVIFLAALQGVDQTYYEAAMIDGANSVQQFFYVTIPMLKNTITLLVLNSMIGSFKVFDIIWVTTTGGPYHATEVISTYIYNEAFVLNRIGVGASAAILLSIIIAICSAVYFRYAEREA